MTETAIYKILLLLRMVFSIIIIFLGNWEILQICSTSDLHEFTLYISSLTIFKHGIMRDNLQYQRETIQRRTDIRHVWSNKCNRSCIQENKVRLANAEELYNKGICGNIFNRINHHYLLYDNANFQELWWVHFRYHPVIYLFILLTNWQNQESSDSNPI